MIVIEIRCDECDVLGDDGRFAGEVREKLAAAGWFHRGAQDWCPRCGRLRAAGGLAVR